MSLQNVEKFLEKVAAEPDLQNKLEKIGDNYIGDQNNLRIVVANNVLPTARECGFDFTVEEYISYVEEAVLAEEAENTDGEALNESDLDAVVGGVLHVSKQGKAITAMYHKGTTPKTIRVGSYVKGNTSTRTLQIKTIIPSGKKSQGTLV